MERKLDHQDDEEFEEQSSVVSMDKVNPSQSLQVSLSEQSPLYAFQILDGEEHKQSDQDKEESVDPPVFGEAKLATSLTSPKESQLCSQSAAYQKVDELRTHGMHQQQDKPRERGAIINARQELSDQEAEIHPMEAQNNLLGPYQIHHAPLRHGQEDESLAQRQSQNDLYLEDLKQQRIHLLRFLCNHLGSDDIKEKILCVRLRVWVLTGTLDYGLSERILTQLAISFKASNIVPTRSSLELYAQPNFRNMF